jgi:hypothetical protein
MRTVVSNAGMMSVEKQPDESRLRDDTGFHPRAPG